MSRKQLLSGGGSGRRGAAAGGGAHTFLELSDTPAAYTGEGLKFVTVTAGETGLEFSPLPPIAITDTFVVASEAAMLALTAETGDVAIRTDINQTFILQGSDPTILANWALLLVSPTHDIGGALHTADTIANVNTKLSDGSMITTRAAEIAALAAKAAPSADDLLIIEDAADSNNKKKTTLSALPFLQWQKINITHTQFQTAALTNTIKLTDLPAGAVVLATRLIPSVIFDGPGILDYYLSIGISGALQDLLTEYQVEDITPGNTEYAEAFSFQSFNYGATQELKITARSTGANLNASTTGAALVEILYIPKAL